MSRHFYATRLNPKGRFVYPHTGSRRLRSDLFVFKSSADRDRWLQDITRSQGVTFEILCADDLIFDTANRGSDISGKTVRVSDLVYEAYWG